jgi:propionyl-CoA carboxylase beta chain
MAPIHSALGGGLTRQPPIAGVTGHQAACQQQEPGEPVSPTNEELNAELEERRKVLVDGGGRQRIEAQHARGKQTARERIDALVDPGTFQEIDAWITHRHTGFGLEEKQTPGDSVIVGFATIAGRRVALAAQDFTVIGGSFSEAQAIKVSKILDLAMGSGVPFIALNDSVGARIQEGVWSLAGYSELFWRNTQASGVIPQISVMLGPCAGGSVYSPGLTDFVIMTEGISHMFITGPEVIKTVTGEEVDFETLGGAQAHASISGVAHLVARDEAGAIALTRRLLGYLPANNVEAPPSAAPASPGFDVDLDTLVPSDASRAYDVRHAILGICDGNSFFEIQAGYAPNAVIGFARLEGSVIGVIANQPANLAGVLDIDASDKIARFVRFCDCFNIPLVTLVDCPGFLPGTHQEHGGIIRHGAKIVYAYSEATVPKIAIITRKAYGGAYIVMSSKHIRTDLVYAWPTAEVAVMGAEGAVSILYRKDLAEATDRDKARERLVESFRARFGTPYSAAASGHIDDVILPHETRTRLIAALRFLRDKQASMPPKKHGNMPL